MDHSSIDDAVRRIERRLATKSGTERSGTKEANWCYQLGAELDFLCYLHNRDFKRSGDEKDFSTSRTTVGELPVGQGWGGKCTLYT